MYGFVGLLETPSAVIDDVAQLGGGQRLPGHVERGYVGRDAALPLHPVALGAGELDEGVRAGGDGRIDLSAARRVVAPPTVTVFDE